MHTLIHPQKTWFIRPILFPLLHAPVLGFMCPYFGAFSGGQGSAWAIWAVCICTSYMQQAVINCVSWHLSITTSINSFSSLCHSSSVVRLDKIVYFASHGHQWALGIHGPVSCWLFLFFLGLCLEGGNQCIPKTPHNTCCLIRPTVPVIKPSQCGPLLNWLLENPYACPFFMLPTHYIWALTVHLLPNVSHPLTGATVMRFLVWLNNVSIYNKYSIALIQCS